MKFKVVIALLCLALAGVANGICDSLVFHYPKTGFEKGDTYWDIHTSWVNKYKNGDIKQGPRFFGSTTFLVSLTDGWHLFKMLQLLFLKLAILLAFSAGIKRPWWFWVLAFIAATLAMSGGFKIFYSWIWG